MIDKIQILSHPHSGSSLLKTMMERCENTVGVDGEATQVFKPIDGMINISKFPMFDSKFQLEAVADHAKVFLVRDPRYAIKSMRERYLDMEVPTEHQRFLDLEYWEWYLEFFVNTSERKIRYRDIFDEERLYMLFDSLKLKPVGDIYGQYTRKLFHKKRIPHIEPSRTDHVNFRQFQLNKPIKNMNEPEYESFFVKEQGIYTEILELKTYKQIFGQ